MMTTSKNLLLLPVGIIILLLTNTAAVSAQDAWFADTRDATLLSQGKNISQLDVERLQQQGKSMKWVPSSQKSFLQSCDPNIPIVVMIHGNWATKADAKSCGIDFHRLSKKFGRHRLLVWSWPSERIYETRLRQDALIKGARADVQARFLAAFLMQLPPKSKVCLVGFSFGSRLSCETLQILATRHHGHHLRLRAVLLAAAMDQHSLRPDGKYGLALGMVEKMLIHVNPKDDTLRWYPLLVSCKGPRAVGREGLVTDGIPPQQLNKINTRNVQHLIKCDHALMKSLLGLLAFREDFTHYALFQ